MEEFLKLFNDYVKNYDLTDLNTMRKYHHSFRVMERAGEIAQSLNLNSLEKDLVLICGLFHDIARFYQWEKYNTYKDFESIDHGDYGVIILKEEHLIQKLTKIEKYQEIILNTVKYHNKMMVPKLDDKTMLFVNIIRDADKLDILETQELVMNDEKIILKKELLDSIYQKQVCSNYLIQSDTDVILKQISWIFDFNFSYSYRYLENKNIITCKFQLLELYGEIEEIEQLKSFVIGEMKKISLRNV